MYEAGYKFAALVSKLYVRGHWSAIFYFINDKALPAHVVRKGFENDLRSLVFTTNVKVQLAGEKVFLGRGFAGQFQAFGEAVVIIVGVAGDMERSHAPISIFDNDVVVTSAIEVDFTRALLARDLSRVAEPFDKPQCCGLRIGAWVDVLNLHDR